MCRRSTKAPERYQQELVDCRPMQFKPLSNPAFGTLALPQRGKEPLDSLLNAVDSVSAAMNAANGLLVVRGLESIAEDPSALVRLSHGFGNHVEDYRETITEPGRVHPCAPQILVVSNQPPSSKLPPARPQPARNVDGSLPVQFPQRRGWHSDQSYRRPPPDISLFYALEPVPPDQGQTLYADGIRAYETLDSKLKNRIEGLYGIHTRSGTGRTEPAVRAGEPVVALGIHERPQRQPVVREHPQTGRRALYLCEAGQMDWVDGPFVDMEPGPHGEGARLLYELMAHYTESRFVYAHEWQRGDLIIYDNRCTIHAATWFDAEKHSRVMWRTTVAGQPGAEYQDEAPSWK